MNIGIRELKSHLSDFVHRAQSGEHVTITDRGRPVALLVPIPTVSDGNLPVALAKGINEGWIRPRKTDAPLAPSNIRLTFPKGMSASQILADDRDER